MTVSAIKVRIPTKFPSSVSASSPITLSTVGGNFNFGLDATALVTSLTGDFQPVIYTPPYTGAASRSVESKLADVLSATDFGIKGDDATANDTAIATAVAYCVANNKTLAFPDGIYRHTNALNWAFNYLQVIALGGNCIFKHTGSGTAHSFSGIANYPASQGCEGGTFGGPNHFIVQGNANTVDLVLVDNWHFGDMKIKPRNASNAFLRTQDTGIVGASAVETTFDVKASTNFGGSFTTVPLYGMRLVSLASCVFIKPILEFVGNVGSGTPGVSMVGCVGCLFLAGTIESCLAGGISLASNCNRNKFINVHAEVNGTQQDWLVSGSENTFESCHGAGTTSGQFLAGNFNFYKNCKLQTGVVQSGASDNTFENCNFITSFNDLGTRTNIYNDAGGIATNKFNRPNIIGGTATALTGLGIRSSGSGAFDVTIRNTENLTAARNFTVTLGDADRSFQMGGNLQLPAVVLGDVWYGSAAGVVSALAGNATTTPKMLTMTGTGAAAQAPVWTSLTAAIVTFLGTPSSANFAAALTDEDNAGVVPFESTGTWTPTDQSGAALSLSSVNCKYTRIGNMVHAYGTFTMPATASGATLLIGGLPVAVANASYASVPSPITNTVGVNGPVAKPVANSANFNIFKNSTGTNAVNSDFTASVITVNIMYPVT